MSSADPLARASDSDPGDMPRTAVERAQWTLAKASTFPSDHEPHAAPGTVSVGELRNPAPKTELSLMQQAQRFANSGDHATAIQVLKRGLAEGSPMAHARGMLATEYLKTGKIRAAIAQLQVAIQLAPSVAANYSNLGFALCRLGDTENGERQVRQAIRLDKDQPKSHYLLGLILLDRGTPEARDELLLARNEVSAARLALAVYDEHHGQMDEAERQIQAFLRMSPSADPAGTEIWVAATAALERPASAFGFRNSQVE
jgi:Tfp pilus assembly protein PilF